MLKRLLLTASTIAILMPAAASAQEGNRFVFRAKAGVLSSADVAVPGPVEPGDDDEDDEEDEGHFTVVHSARIWPVTDILFPGSFLRIDTMIHNATGQPATAADYGDMVIRLDPASGDPLGFLAVSPRPACPNLTNPLPSGSIFQCTAIDIPITLADVCAISGNRISGTLASDLRIFNESYRVDVLNDTFIYDMAVDKSGCDEEELDDRIAVTTMTAPEIPGWTFRFEGWDRAPVITSASVHWYSNLLALQIESPTENCLYVEARIDLNNGYKTTGTACPGGAPYADTGDWSDHAGVEWSDSPAEAPATSIVARGETGIGLTQLTPVFESSVE